jgi:xylulokinase
MQLLGVDVGTTHCKAGLFDTDGSLIMLTRRTTPTRQDSDGSSFYDPDELWHTVAAAIHDITTKTAPERIAAVGVASMAETGLLLDRRTGAARTHFIPWFDTGATPQAEQIAREADLFERFCATGQRPSFKSGLAKILALRAHDHDITDDTIWLSTADYIVYRLTGELATDYTLATRTYAFRIDHKTWDEGWLDHWGLVADLFPPAKPSGVPAGVVTGADRTGLARGTPVAVAGHDHLCAALAVGAVEPTGVFDSMGTAETLIGALQERPLGRSEYEAGLGYGCHVIKDRLYWMGGLSTSGGSVEWLRALLGEPPLSYDDFLALVDAAGPEPTGIIYFPYLLGSGTPHSDPHTKAAFIGLSAAHGRAQVAKAVLEGTAYELEFIRRAAEGVTGASIEHIVAAGGGTRNHHWLQIKADVSGCRLDVPPVPEATVLGAALVAGIGCGIYRDAGEAVHSIQQQPSATFVPDRERHRAYRQVYEHGFLSLQEPLRQVYGRAARSA